MFPERAPEDKPFGERTVHEQLRLGLDDQFTVFYSVAWHGRGQHADGEADFLVAHPSLGLLVIEVKGGSEITFDAASGEWYTLSKGERKRIKDPFEQAKGNKYALLDEITADVRWPARRTCQIGYAVIFPDAVPAENVLARAKAEITFDRRHMSDLASRIVSCMVHWREVDPRDKLGADGVEALVKMFGASKWQVTLTDILEQDERRIIDLTEQQFGLLDLLSRRRRVAISGCAGSGKTVLAFEKARRLAESGRRVLLTCFNRNLAGYLRESRAIPRTLDIVHFHGLCVDAVRSGGIQPPADRAEGERYIEWLPDGLLEALSASPSRYDAIVVDEGQDFARAWYDVLEMMLADGPDGQFYAFYDDNQRLYSDGVIPDWLGEPYPLTRDCRNTNQIGRVVRGLYSGPEISLSGIEGRDVVFVSYADNAGESTVLARVDEVLGQLRKAGAKVSDVVVLSPRRDGPVWSRRDYGRWRLYSEYEVDGDLYYSTIHGFKGQESRVVILVELEAAGMPGDDWKGLEELLYVGCSRPTTQLVVVAAETIVSHLQGLVVR